LIKYPAGDAMSTYRTARYQTKRHTATESVINNKWDAMIVSELCEFRDGSDVVFWIAN
jgi:hypothetical protein